MEMLAQLREERVALVWQLENARTQARRSQMREARFGLTEFQRRVAVAIFVLSGSISMDEATCFLRQKAEVAGTPSSAASFPPPPRPPLRCYRQHLRCRRLLPRRPVRAPCQSKPLRT